jgi:hypothetical protein
MSLRPSSDAAIAVSDVENAANVEVSNYPHNTGSKENENVMIDGSTTTETMSDTQLDVSLPLNWPIRKKFLNMAVPSFICFVVLVVPISSLRDSS